MSSPQKSVIERAYELAQSRGFDGLESIIRQLSREGYVNPRLALFGADLRRRLLAISRGEAVELKKSARQRRTRSFRPKVLGS